MTALARELKLRLQSADHHPVIGWCGVSGDLEAVLSGPNLWVLGLERLRELREQGLRPGDFVHAAPEGQEFLVHLIAAAIGGFVLIPDSEESHHRIVANPLRQRFFRKDIVLGLLTSGTSGPAKRVFYSSDGILWQLKNHAAWFGHGSGPTRLCLLPWTHSFGLVLDLLLGLFEGSTLLCPAEARFKQSRSWLMAVLRQHSIDLIAAVPRQLEFLLFEEALSLPPKTLYTGGAAVSPDLRRRAEAWIGERGRLVEGYGLTEAGPGVALNGWPLGCEVRVGDQEIQVRSPYWGLDEALEASTDWVATGDLGTIDSKGQLQVVGRKSRRVKASTGEWLSLDEVEEALLATAPLRAAHIAFDSEGPTLWLLPSGGPVGEAAIAGVVERIGKRLGAPVRSHVLVPDEALLRRLGHAKGKDLRQFFLSETEGKERAVEAQAFRK